MILSFLIFGYLGSKVVYEEDITKLLPSTETGGNEQLVFRNLKVKDKIFVLFTGDEPEKLSMICDDFMSVISNADSTNVLLDNVLYDFDEEMLIDAVGYLYDNAPVFIPTSSYDAIEESLSEDKIEMQMSSNFEILGSAAGGAMMDLVRIDPIGLRNTIFSGTGDLKESMGGNYLIYDSHFFTTDTTVALAFISPAFKSFDAKHSIELIDLIDKAIVDFRQKYPSVEILYHGAPVQSVYNSRQIKKDLIMTLSVSMIIISLIIGLCFKNKSTLFLLILPVIYGAIFALAMIYIIKGGMSLMALGIGAIVLGVALSYCLHVITHYKYVTDPVKVLEDQTVPVILGCLTTIGSFMGLLFTKSELLKDFGLFASLALIGTTFFALVFLPHLFNTKRNKRSDKAFAFLEKINSYPFEKQKWLIGIIVILFGASLYLKNFVTFDSDLKNIGYHEENVVRSQKIFTEKTARGMVTTYYAATSDNLDSAILKSREITRRLEILKDEGLLETYSKGNSLFLTEKEQEERIECWNNYWSNSKVDNVKKSLIKYGSEYGFRETTFRPFLEMISQRYEPVSICESDVLPEALMSNIIEVSDDSYMIFTSVTATKENQNKVSDEIASIPGSLVIDPFYYTSDMVSLINKDFNMTLAISSFFVFIVLLISFKSLVLAILAFLPMAMSWVIVLGIMGAMGLQFNLINIVISTFIFGIGVDYSIFIMDGLISKYQSNKDVLIFHKTAIIFSAIVLITGVVSLMFATHPAIKSIGFSTLIGMSATVLLSYTLQPFLFGLLIKAKQKTGTGKFLSKLEIKK